MESVIGMRERPSNLHSIGRTGDPLKSYELSSLAHSVRFCGLISIASLHSPSRKVLLVASDKSHDGTY